MNSIFSNMNPFPGADIWRLPCGCGAWKWAGVESWTLCQPHLIAHNVLVRKDSDFVPVFTGLNSSGLSTEFESCSCLLCLAGRHGKITPAAYAKLIVSQGEHEYNMQQAAIDEAREELAQRDAQRDIGAMTKLVMDPPKSGGSIVYCGCRFVCEKGEWRVAKPCKTHKTESKANRRKREDRENERRKA